MSKRRSIKLTLDPETQQLLDIARKEWDALRRAGTPYWCTHKYEVTDERAVFFRTSWVHPLRNVRLSHGVVCSECWGFIQAG